jgi:hypothetical protein
MNRGIFTSGPSLAAIDNLMDQLQEAIRNGDNAEAAALQTQIDQVRAQAEAAEVIGSNARDMVLRRDTRLNSLEDVAARFTEIITSAEATHDQLRQDIANVQLKPGPAGKDSTVPGPQGDSAYDVARQAGYSGTKAQWLASLKGEPGTPADTAVLAALAARVDALEKLKIQQVEYRDGIAVPAVLSLLGISATVDVTVTWPNAFPDTNYFVTPQLTTAAALIGKTTPALKTKTTTGCVITVTTTALISTGQATLSAVAYRKG